MIKRTNTLSFLGGLTNFTQRSKIRKLRELYYITHINNIPSVLQRGILSHERIDSEKLDYTPIYDLDIVSNRKSLVAPNGKSLWGFANLYFNARNPMLYRVVFEKGADSIAVVRVDKGILKLDGVFVSDGNAASSYSEIVLPSTEIFFLRYLKRLIGSIGMIVTHRKGRLWRSVLFQKSYHHSTLRQSIFRVMMLSIK